MGIRMKVAVAQMAPIFLNGHATVKKVCDWIARAGGEDARWVVFPEIVIPGYPYLLMTLPSMATGPISRELFENAVIVPGAETELPRLLATQDVVLWLELTSELTERYTTRNYFSLRREYAAMRCSGRS